MRAVFLLGLFLYAQHASSCVKYDRRLCFLQVEGGPELQATIQLPKENSRPVPTLLIFGGFESAGKVLSLLHPSMPVALASFDYPFHASRDLRFPESLADLPEARRVFPRTVSGIHALVARLRTMPEIDPKRIIVVGASFGTPFAVAAASEDPGISGLVVVHGFGRPAETAENVILRSWLPRFGWTARPLAWLLSRGLWFYLGMPEPEHYAERLRKDQRVLMISAEQDSFVPKESSEALAQAIGRSGASLERARMPGEHLMPGADTTIAAIIARIEAWLS